MILLNVGDWVHFAYDGEKATGFIVAKSEEIITVQVTIPTPLKIVTVHQNEVVEGSPLVWPDDIPALIDLALYTKDEQWFDEWVQELKRWKPIDSLI